MNNNNPTSATLAEGAKDNYQRLLNRPRPPFDPIRNDISVSFEFFPPATEKMEKTLWRRWRKHCGDPSRNSRP